MQSPHPWFKIREVEDDVHVIEETGHVQSYLVNGRTHSALIDTGMGFADIRAAVEHLLRPRVMVLNTHWHFDHIGGNALFEDIGIAAAEKDLIGRSLTSGLLTTLYGEAFVDQASLGRPKGFEFSKWEIQGSPPTFLIAAGDRIDLGDRILEAIATPGHSHGSTSFVDHRTRALFVGDFVYRDTFFVQFVDSDPDIYLDSLGKVISRMCDFKNLYPAHGPYPLSTAFFETARTAFQHIQNGAPPDEIDRSWPQICHRYRFDGFDILVKPPGTRGVELFAAA